MRAVLARGTHLKLKTLSARRPEVVQGRPIQIPASIVSRRLAVKRIFVTIVLSQAPAETGDPLQVAALAACALQLPPLLEDFPRLRSAVYLPQLRLHFHSTNSLQRSKVLTRRAHGKQQNPSRRKRAPTLLEGKSAMFSSVATRLTQMLSCDLAACNH